MAGAREDLDAEYRRLIRACLAASDWHGVYSWSKGWVGSGGGALLLDPWLASVASGRLHGERRRAVHAVDLALRHWIEPEADRAILHWVRSCVVRFALNDPRTAALDLEAATPAAPRWLRADLEADIRACAGEAASSRKRKPSVDPAPPYVGHGDVAVAPPNNPVPPPGTRPQLWDDVLPLVRRGEADAGTGGGT